MGTIHLEDVFVKDANTATRLIAGETILVPVRDRVGDLSSIYVLNEIGTLLWQNLNGRNSVQQLIESVVGAYDVLPDTAGQDVHTFLSDLREKELIKQAGDVRADETYSQFSMNVHTRVLSERIPITGSLEISRRCPLQCVHCYNNLPMGDVAARDREVSLEEYRRILDELADAGCLWLLFTGGEIFARKDFLDIYIYAKKKGFLITLFTNGTLITPKVADTLLEWRPFSIEITLYGRTRETYEKLTGIPGSYDRCIRGIQLLLERGLPLKLKTVAVTINKHEIHAMQKFAVEELGVEFRFDGLINPRIDCSQSPLEVRLKPHEVVAFDLQDEERMNDWGKFQDYFSNADVAPEHSDELYQCGGGVTSFAIDPYGMMSICVLSEVDKYDLRKGSFREGWDGFLGKVRRKKVSMPTKCTHCSIRSMCGMCPATAELESGDPEKPVDFLCHTAHLRAKAFGYKVRPHGDCEYCEGGINYPNLLDSVQRLNESTQDGSQLAPLPIVAQSRSGCGSGGCSSCSTSAIHQAKGD